MKELHRLSIVLILVVLVAVCCDNVAVERESGKAGPQSKDLLLRPKTASVMALTSEVKGLMESGAFSAAEAKVDQNLNDSAFGVLMHEFKAELLAKRGANSEAVGKYLALLHGSYGDWTPGRADLRVPFDLSVQMGRTEDAAEFASAIIDGGTSFSEFQCLHIPETGASTSETLSYANLVLALTRVGKMDKQGRVDYCLAAHNQLPNSALVKVHLALAYHARGNSGDRELCRTLLSEAYQSSPTGSEMRTAANHLSVGYGMGPLP